RAGCGRGEREGPPGPGGSERGSRPREGETRAGRSLEAFSRYPRRFRRNARLPASLGGRFLYRAPPCPPGPARSTRSASLQAERPHGFFMRDSFAAVAFEPVAGLAGGVLFFF